MEVEDSEHFNPEELKDLPLDDIYPHLEDTDPEMILAVITALLVYSENQPECKMELISHDVIDKCVEYLNIENDDIQLASIDLMISLLENNDQAQKDILRCGGIEKLVAILHGTSEPVKIDASKLLFELVVLDKRVFGKIKEIGFDQIISVIPNTNNSEIKFSLLAILANGCDNEEDAINISNNGIYNQFIPLIHNSDENIKFIGITLLGVLAQFMNHEELVKLGSNGMISALLSLMKTNNDKIQAVVFSAIQNLTYHCKENGNQIDINSLEYITLCIKVKDVEIQDSCVWILIHLALDDIHVNEIKEKIHKHDVLDFFEVLTRDDNPDTRNEAFVAYNKYK